MKPFRWVTSPIYKKKLVCHVKSFCHTHKIGTRNIGSNTQDKDIKWSWYHLNLNHLLIHKQIPLHVVFITFSLTSFTSFLLNFFFVHSSCSHFTASHGKCMEYPIRMNEMKKDENVWLGLRRIWRIFLLRGVWGFHDLDCLWIDSVKYAWMHL